MTLFPLHNRGANCSHPNNSNRQLNSIHYTQFTAMSFTTSSTTYHPLPSHSATSSSSSSSSLSDPLPLPPWCLPLTPPQCTYTAQYCEENSYKLVQQILKRLPNESTPSGTMKPTSNSGDDELKDTAASVSSPVKPVASNESILSLTHEESIYPTLASERVFVIFMSNVWEELRLYRQRIGDPMNHGYVHWDYHVIVAMKPSQSIYFG